MKTQFTEGPWVFLRQGKEIQSDGGHEIISAMNGLPVLLASLPVYSENSDHERAYDVSKTESIANGYLLAAAPAMYEALKEMVDMFNPYVHCIKSDKGVDATQKAIAAIAAAEGRK